MYVVQLTRPAACGAEQPVLVNLAHVELIRPRGGGCRLYFAPGAEGERYLDVAEAFDALAALTTALRQHP